MWNKRELLQGPHISLEVISLQTYCNCGQTILNSTDAFKLMYTLIRRLKLKDKRTESYNMNKKQNCTNCQRNTANKKRR